MTLQAVAAALSVLAATAQAYRQEKVQPHKAYAQQFDDRYSPLKYLGGLGPYNTRSGAGISPDVPDGCTVDQVVILGRHGERAPDPSEVKSHYAVLDKIAKGHPEPFVGDLAFLNGWTYAVSEEELGTAGLLLQDSPYSGAADLYAFGGDAAAKYGHLWDKQSTVPIFAAETNRVVESAKAFGEGFFGYNYSDVVALNILKDNNASGADSLSPRYCSNATRTTCDLADKVSLNGVYNIVFPELDVAAVRLNKEYGLDLTGYDVGELFDIAAYDVSARGWSPWIDVFTANEWISYNYRKSLWFDCYFGSQSYWAKSAGASFLNATQALFNQGPDAALPIALNFAHDTDIVAVLAGGGLLEPSKKLSTKNVVFNTGFELNDIVPMGARLVIERLNCKAPFLTNTTDLVSANASLPEQFLNNSVGIWNGTVNNVTGYFPNVTLFNGTNATTSANATRSNSTVVPPFANATGSSNATGFNATSSNATHSNTTAPFSNTTVGSNSTGSGNQTFIGNSTGAGNTTTKLRARRSLAKKEATYNISGSPVASPGFNYSAPEPVQESIFVRVLLNDAVLPLDFGYEGPGYSVSLEKFTAHVAAQVKKHSYAKECQPAAKGVPAIPTFWWNYNTTTELDPTNITIPYQATNNP